MSMNIKQMGFRDLVGQIVVRGTGANDPPFNVLTGAMRAYEFSASVMKEVFLIFHVDHDYAPGTPIYLHTHWATAGTNTGNVRWGFEYTAAKGHQQQAFPATTTVFATQAGSATPLLHHIAEIVIGDVVPAANLEPDSLLMIRVFRDAANVADTNTDIVSLLTADCHYQSDRSSTPNKAFPFS